MVKKELEQKGLQVWVPDLPQADQPNIARYNEFIFQNQDWIFDEETAIVGHSSGAVAILGLLQHLPNNTKVGTCILVGSFKNDLGWSSLSELFLEELNFELIRSKAQKFILVHSDNDPYCPLEHAEYLAEKLNGQLIVKTSQGHFNTNQNPEYTKFPFLLELLEKEK